MILLVFFNLFSFWFTFSKKHLKQANPSHGNEHIHYGQHQNNISLIEKKQTNIKASNRRL